MASAKNSSPRQPTDEQRFPQLFKPLDQQIDRQKCGRKVEMKVLVLGMSRTGTVSMWIALQQLGFVETYHTISIFGNVSDCRMWRQAIEAKFFGQGKPFEREDWDKLLGHCQAVCDLPTAAFIPELVAAYPDAKVILVDRPVADWYKSMSATLQAVVNDRFLQILAWVDPDFIGLWYPMLQKLWVGLYGQGPNAFKMNGKAVYQRQYDEIRSLVPKKQLHEMRIGQGWEGMCAFLGKDIPKTPFPKTNEGEQFHHMFWLMKKLAVRRVLSRFLLRLSIPLGIVLIGLSLWLWRDH